MSRKCYNDELGDIDSTSTYDTATPEISLENIRQAIIGPERTIEPYHIIPVWVGDNFLSLLSDYPIIVKNSNIDENTLFIMAGMGVACGEKIYDLLWEEGYLAIWTDKPLNNKLFQQKNKQSNNS